ncbi:MAG: threonine/serine exporter family protein [Alistipes shahii]
MDPIFTLVFVGLANASFCKLFGGDWTAVGIVFNGDTPSGLLPSNSRMQARAVNHFLVFRLLSAFVASLCATAALRFDRTAEITLATSPAVFVPGVPLYQRGHRHHGRTSSLAGVSRLVNAMPLIVCIAVGLSATLLMVKDSLL